VSGAGDEEKTQTMSELAQSFRDLEAYRAAFRFRQRVFETIMTWPSEERFALADQMRRSARSIGANLAEAWAKRRYPAHFLGQLTDSDGALQTTIHWLESAAARSYLSHDELTALLNEAASVGKRIGSMIVHHESFCTAR
jgi:four helix bundle protein